MNGKTIQHYKIGARLGAGAMGEVYAAEDTRLGRQVALKFLPASYQYDPDRRMRFIREARAASGLRSPHVAAIYDIGEDEGASFIVMEYIEGQTLAQQLSTRGSFPPPETIEVAMQVADALDEANARGIVHRDIKTSNIMIDRRGLVKVLDFGLAKVIAPVTRDSQAPERTVEIGGETVAGLILGTVSYMSPEQALGRTIDHRSDIFSLGVVIYEMLSGRRPFDSDSATETIDAILHREPPALARFNYSVPSELDRVVRKALEKSADFRYQTARDLYIDLHGVKRQLDTGILPHRSGELPTQRLPNLGGQAAPQPIRNAVAIMTFQNITKEAADDWIGAGIAETVTADLKSIQGLSVIGRERIFEMLRNLGSGELNELDEKFAIDIGRRLGASWTITGGYQRIADQIRITARFVDVMTGALLKTVKIDGKIGEIFDLQDRIVYELSQGMNLVLDDSEIGQIERRETESVVAYENFSRGMMNLRNGSRDSLDRAIYLFEKAIEHDPNYAAAWAALGAAYDLKGSFLSVPELSHKAIECERKAISINPRLASAHRWLGASYSTLGQFDEAIEAIKEAIRLDPASAGAHASLGRTYWVGKGMLEEGITEFEHAIAINPEAGWAYLQLALLHALRGNYARAEAMAKRAIELQEHTQSGSEGLRIIGAHVRLGYAYYCQGRYEEAIGEYEIERQLLQASDHALRDRALIEVHQKMGAAYLRKGNAEEAEKYFNKAIKDYEQRVATGADDPSTKYYIACVYALRGDSDRALKYLEETLVHLRALNTLRARTDPDLASVRSLPRFKEIVGQTS